MASNASQKAPAFVFEYLPKKATAAPTAAESLSASLYNQTSAFLSSFTKTITPSPKLTIEQQRSATLQQVKAGFESHMAAKQKAGIAVRASEQEDVPRVEKAIQKLARDAQAT